MEILYLKNMVCSRCVLFVEQILIQLDIPYHKIKIGEIHLCNPLDEITKSNLSRELESIGLEIIDNRLNQLIEKAKQLIIQKARNAIPGKDRDYTLSRFLSQKLAIEYTYLSSLFSSIEGRTIENYFIEQRIEKVKEMLVYDQLSLSEIAFTLNYSSVAHLSSQFKKTTGLTPSHFKKIGDFRMKSLDLI